MPRPQLAPDATAGSTAGGGRARSNIEVLILSYNEAANLPHALASVMSWADAVHVVDSGSTDGSQAIAHSHGANVVHRPWLGYARQKNWALDNLPLKSDWVFILDSDESITPELRDELLAMARRPVSEVPEAGFYVNRLTKFMGSPIRHAGYYPSYNLRFFRRGTAQYEDREVHEHMVVNGPTRRLRHEMLHEDRRGLEHFIAKHNRYSTLEARELMREMVRHQAGRAVRLERGIATRRWLKNKVLPRLPLSGVWRFMYMYVLRLGVLDGLPGFRFCLLLATYDTFISLKLAELRALGADKNPSLLEEPKVTAAARGLAVPEGELSVVPAVQTDSSAPAITPSAPTPTGTNYLRLTAKSREAMHAANLAADQFPHEYVGTEHILLGLISDESNAAVRILMDMHVDIKGLRSLTIGRAQPGAGRVTSGRKPLTSRAKQVVDHSVDEARAMAHGHVGTEHLLLGLMREPDGVAARVLSELGVEIDRVRDLVRGGLTTLAIEATTPVDAPSKSSQPAQDVPSTGHPAPDPIHAQTERHRAELANLSFPPGQWPAKGSVPVSVLIPVKNEQRNIIDCIRHCMWASEIVVVDSQSTDQTIPMSQALNADVYQFYYSKEGWPKKKNWALENVPWKNEWVLILDADEFMTPELTEEVRQVVTGAYAAPDPKKAGCGDGYWLNRRFMFMGRWIRGCGYYPSWNVRLFKHKVGRYERIGTLGQTGSGDNEVHEHVVLSTGPAGYLENEFLHYAYPDLTAWIEKHNRYTTWEAHAMKAKDAGAVQASLFGGPIERRRFIKRFARKLPLRPTLRFLFSYLVQLGIRDGYPGYVMCRLLAWYEFVSLAKFYEMEAQKSDVTRRDAAQVSGKPL